MLKSHSVLVPLSFHCHSNVDGLVQASFQEKPLTDEEREAKAAEIRERLAAKRSQREKEEAQAQRAAEQRRREDGKSAVALREEMERQEMLRIAQAKRKEKQEDARRKRAILQQIEADKAAKKAEAEAAKRARAAASEQAAADAPAKADKPKKEHTEAKLQIRRSQGDPISMTLAPNDTVGDVIAQVISLTHMDPACVKLSSTYPRKTYTIADEGVTLKAAGLVPSAVLMLR
eukprot:TRINITY_DN10669_c0_g3_i2.p1 TRINITY_DN10669_c0_g3~~TRINITY_DN10669_c0_g3_i2.p1  ORF type:complete len:232 (+),score=75.75 TRINITY_DN10669_c0_g3_i2:377-1072(+)